MAAPLAVVAAWGGSGTNTPSATSPIAIGYELPLTGTVALPGKQEQEGWNLGLRELGQRVDGHRIVTYFEDTSGNPAVALSDARSLVQTKHIQIMEGPLLASEDAAVAPYPGAQHIPLDNLALCSSAQLTSDAHYGNALSSGWLCDQPDVMAAQYCDGISTPANNTFTSLFKKTYHVFPGYYAEAGYVHAELAVAALRRLHGDAANPAAVTHALKTTPITAPRGPVRLNTLVDAPIQNIYICKVESVHGTLEDVPIRTYPNVEPWGTLPYRTWRQEFSADSTGRPPG